MYSVIVRYENLVEVYRLKEYNQKIKEAIECISTYGCDYVEFVFKGEMVETMHKPSSIKEMIKRFEDSEFFESYYEEEDKERIEEYKKILRECELDEQ